MSRRGVEIEGLDEFVRDMRRGPKELRDRGRTISRRFAEQVVETAQAKARGSGIPQLAAVASTIRAVNAEIPSIRIGGAKKVTSSGATAGQIHFGADFGAHEKKHPQFPNTSPIRGGRAVYPAAEEHGEDGAEAWLELIERLVAGGPNAGGPSISAHVARFLK